jgi:DNA-binding Xre family transcriptional regulator
MPISYMKLRKLLVEYDITHEKLRKGTGLTTTEVAKIRKGNYMNLQSIELIIKYLNQTTGKKLKIDDILDFVDCK